MFKRVDWKSLFKCFAWIVCLGGIVTLMSFVEAKKHTVKCTNIKILIPGADNFIEREEIDAILKQSEGQLIGRNLEAINLNAIEEKIKANPYIAMSTVYADMEGVIHIEISQRQPLLRVINAGGQDFYIDRDGLKMPVSPNFTANVLVANGRILERFTGKVDTLITKMASDLYKTALFLKKDTLWDAQIEQVFVDDKDDIELVPRVGNQRIILGSADSLQTKMDNLLTFYKKAMPQVGWDTYKTINVKFSNQIVCERNKPDSLHTGTEAGRVFKPTMASAKKVTDSIVKAEIAAEMKNNPVEDEVSVPAVAIEKKKAAPAPPKVVPVVHAGKPVVKTVHENKPAVKAAVKKAVPETETAKKEKVKTEVLKKETPKRVTPKPVTPKAAPAKTTAPKAEVKKWVKPVPKAEPKKQVKTTHFPEVKWVSPAPKTAKPKVLKPNDEKATKKNK